MAMKGQRTDEIKEGRGKYKTLALDLIFDIADMHRERQCETTIKVTIKERLGIDKLDADVFGYITNAIYFWVKDLLECDFVDLSNSDIFYLGRAVETMYRALSFEYGKRLTEAWEKRKQEKQERKEHSNDRR